MKKLLVGSVVTGVILSGFIRGSVAAWHPQGQIKKSVQNVTAGGQVSDANDAKSAVQAKPGDTLKYVIEVSNTGKADSNGMNDMYKTVLTDTLPTGVELTSNPAQRQISENLGVVKPGQKVSKEYTVRVAANQADKSVITNKACFTGNSEVNDAPQSGCDNAVVNISVPQTSSAHTEEPKGQGSAPAPQVAAAITTLPETGAGSVVAIFAGITTLGYAGHLVVSRKRQ
jgi:uncharacterized repeat protein (TIGR01451 family)